MAEDAANPWPSQQPQPQRQAQWASLRPWSKARHDEGAEGLWRWPSGLLVPVRMLPGRDSKPRYMVRLDVRTRSKHPTFRADIAFGAVRLHLETP